MECFVLKAFELAERLNPHYYRPKYVEIDKKIEISNYESKRINDFAKVICGPFGSSIKVEDYKNKGIPLIRISNIDDNQQLSDQNITFISEDLAGKLKSYKIKEGDLIISQRGTLGLIAKVPSFFKNAIISANFIAIKNIKEVSADYLKIVLSSKYGQMQIERRISGQVQTKITTDDIKYLKIPILPQKVRSYIVEIIESAISQKIQKEQESNKLLNSFEEIVFKEIGLKLPEQKQKAIFSINVSKLEGAINPERYAKGFKLDASFNWIEIKDVGIINRETFTPSKEEPGTEYSLLRIDDLENYPQTAVIRDIKGKDISGVILKVEQSDVLIARLGPTLENKKFIIVPKAKKPLVASTEFIDLRCNEKNNPIFVISILKTDFYKNLMIQKARGATPSRRRLSHEDFAKLPFPKVDLNKQNKIAEEIAKTIKIAGNFKKESKIVLNEAKAEIDKLILGEK